MCLFFLLPISPATSLWMTVIPLHGTFLFSPILFLFKVFPLLGCKFLQTERLLFNGNKSYFQAALPNFALSFVFFLVLSLLHSEFVNCLNLLISVFNQ